MTSPVIHICDFQTHPGDCGGGDIYFSNTDCTGAQITASSARDCCVGTDDGFSYGILKETVVNALVSIVMHDL